MTRCLKIKSEDWIRKQKIFLIQQKSEKLREQSCLILRDNKPRQSRVLFPGSDWDLFPNLLSFPPHTAPFQKPMMRGSPGPPGAMRSSLPNFANINNIHQCEIHMKPRKRQNFLQVDTTYWDPSSDTLYSLGILCKRRDSFSA